MNRKQKIIVSVTGIFLVLLILVGLTYAYFLTRIVGNTNDKSISVTTANLVLTYGDGNGILEVANKLQPGDDIQFYRVDSEGNKILDDNGEPIKETSKTFTVTNDGDDTDYVVIVDNVSITKDGETTTFVSNDFEYTLTCISSDDNSCDGVDASTFPLSNQSILVGNKIASGVTHTYTLTMRYLETNVNQSDDMGKTFTARINIEDIRRLDNPYSSNTNSLAYNIINNSLNATNGTELLSYPLTKVAEEISTYGTGKFENIVATSDNGFYQWDYLSYGETAEEANSGANYIEDLGLEDDVAICNTVKGQHISDEGYCMDDCIYIGKVEDCTSDGKPIIPKEVKEHEETLSVAQDDYGTSYYYRGNVQDNYVNFAGMCWRVVRIDGNANTKLILEDQDNECEASNGNWNIPASDGESITMDGSNSYLGGNYGYEIKNVDSDSSNESIMNDLIMNYLNPGGRK